MLRFHFAVGRKVVLSVLVTNFLLRSFWGFWESHEFGEMATLLSTSKTTIRAQGIFTCGRLWEVGSFLRALFSYIPSGMSGQAVFGETLALLSLSGLRGTSWVRPIFFRAFPSRSRWQNKKIAIRADVCSRSR